MPVLHSLISQPLITDRALVNYGQPNSPQLQLEKTYNAAADHYDHPALSFWNRFARRMVERLPLASAVATATPTNATFKSRETVA